MGLDVEEQLDRPSDVAARGVVVHLVRDRLRGRVRVGAGARIRARSRVGVGVQLGFNARVGVRLELGLGPGLGWE